MKKLFIVAILAISVSASAFAAGNIKVNSAVLHSFQFEFKNAANVSWSPTGKFAKATFTVNGQRMEAFYNINGEIVGTSKAITLDELPVNAKRALAKKFDGYSVKEAIRFEGTDEAAYYISAENEKEKVIFKVSDNSEISTFEKSKK